MRVLLIKKVTPIELSHIKKYLYLCVYERESVCVCSLSSMHVVGIQLRPWQQMSSSWASTLALSHGFSESIRQTKVA